MNSALTAVHSFIEFNNQLRMNTSRILDANLHQRPGDGLSLPADPSDVPNQRSFPLIVAPGGNFDSDLGLS